jgi:two-component system sensor histidine kinase/response regulator
LVDKLLQWIKPPAQPVSSSPGTSSATQGETRKLVANIAGLDVRLGLRHVSGRESLYLNLLSRFVSGQADAPARIASALAASNWKSAEIEAHTLKGVAAQIGATEIQTLAGQLEQAIHQQQPLGTLLELQTRIATTLPRLLDGIKQGLPLAPSAPDGVPIDAEAQREICRELARQLSNDDFASGQFIEDNEAVLRSALGEHFPKIAASVKHYEFSAALCRLEEALLTHNITL